MFLYTVVAAFIAVAAGILLAARTKKADGVIYGKLDRAGRITNILLIVVYACLSPLYLFLGMISYPAYDGFLEILGWIVSIVNASAALFCGLGLGMSVQFMGVVGIGLSVGLYCLLAGNLIKYLN